MTKAAGPRASWPRAMAARRPKRFGALWCSSATWSSASVRADASSVAKFSAVSSICSMAPILKTRSGASRNKTVASRYHVDTDFLIYALGERGPARKRLMELADSDAEIQMSAVAWYEFCRGPRTPEQLAVARSFFLDDGIIPFDEKIAGA